MASPETVAPQADARRAERLRVRSILWEHAALKRVRSCGHHAVNPEGLVGIKLTTTPDSKKAGFSGLATCGSVWACPVCNAKIASRRAEELADVVTRWEASGGFVAMVTLTMRHAKDQRLDDLWSGLSYAWSKATSGRGWKNDTADHGTYIDGKKRIPWTRAVEVTHGKSGWHVHVHALLFLRGNVDLDGLADSMFGRWVVALERRGLSAVARVNGQSVGVDIKRIDNAAANDASDYLLKSTYAYSADSAGWELAGGAMKDARGSNRAAFRILRDFVDTGDLDDLDLWHEYERASRGRMQLTWSRGFRDHMKAGPEISDEEIAAEELGGELIQTIAADEWRQIRRRQADILRAAELLPLDTLKAHPVSTWLVALDMFDPPATA